MELEFNLWPFEFVLLRNDRVLLMLKVFGHPSVVFRLFPFAMQLALDRCDLYWGVDTMDCPIFRCSIVRTPLSDLEKSGRIKYRKLPFGWRFRKDYLSGEG